MYIPGCGRCLVAIARMPRSTDMARSSAPPPEIFLPPATRSMQEARSMGWPACHIPGQQQRPPGWRHLVQGSSRPRWQEKSAPSRVGPRTNSMPSLCFFSEDLDRLLPVRSGGRAAAATRTLQPGGGRQAGPAIACCQAALVEQLVHGPFAAIRLVMLRQPGLVGPARLAVAKCSLVTPAGLPACPASETPPARCWWLHLDP